MPANGPTSESPAGGRAGARLGLLAAGLVALGVLARSAPAARALAWVTAAVAGLGPWGPPAFAAAYALATVLMVPGSVLTLAAGALFGPVVGAAVAWSGATAGSAAAFLIARGVGRGPVERLVSTDPRFRALDDAVRRGGWRVVALLRLSPAIPFNVQNYGYGLTSLGFWPYVLTSAAAMLPGAALYATLGAAGRELAAGSAPDRGPAGWALLALGLAATAAATAYLARLLRGGAGGPPGGRPGPPGCAL